MASTRTRSCKQVYVLVCEQQQQQMKNPVEVDVVRQQLTPLTAAHPPPYAAVLLTQ